MDLLAPMLILSIVALTVVFCFFKSLLWAMLEITLCMLWDVCDCRTLTSLLLFVPMISFITSCRLSEYL